MNPKAPYAECDECPLAPQRHVLGQGPDQADVVVVGEAPGKDEVRAGIPFTGPSGRLLNKVLEAQGIPRESVYVTNAVLCRPPGNETPTAKEVKHCRKRLIEEIKGRKPKVVLAVGAVASKDLLKTTEGITKTRVGPGRESEELGARVISTFHTAAALRAPDRFPAIVADVKKITHPMKLGWEPTKYEVPKDGSEAINLLSQQLGSTEMLSLDIENAAPFDPKHPNWLCIGISERPGHAVVYPPEILDAIKPHLCRGLSDTSKRWLMHNGKYDIKYLWEFAPYARTDEDTMLLHYATDERKGTHKLEYLATELLGTPFYKKEAMDSIEEAEDEEKASLADLPPDTLYRYNATDCDVTYRLYDILKPEAEADNVMGVYKDILIPASNVIAKMEYEGVSVNVEQLEKIEVDIRGQMEQLEDELSQWVENPRSPVQIKKKLWEMGYKVPDTQEDTIKDIGEAFTNKIIEYRGHHKIIKTYISGKKGIIPNLAPDRRVHPSFLLHGTETGRTSCRRPNLQNIPIDHPIRECFTADGPDRVLIEADYSQIELRVIAVLAQEPTLLEVFASGEHIHKEVAKALFGPNYNGREYVDAKSVSYGTIYGEHPPHLAYRTGRSLKEAEEIQTTFFKRFPKILDYRDEIEQQVLENGYVRSYFGRVRRFWLVTYDNKKDILKEAWNFPIQSVAGDITTTALIRLGEKGLIPRMIIHDELVAECHKDEAEEVGEFMKAEMEAANPLDIPIPVDVSVSPYWKMKEGA